uniref:Fibroblast growth factor n=1 Tax=Cyprinus carpio TaxID=7962 RepID=A0A8C1X559_CYPCA
SLLARPPPMPTRSEDERNTNLWPPELTGKAGVISIRSVTVAHGSVHGSRIRLQLQATAVGEVVIKGICANRYLAMNADGRLIGTRRTTDECYFLERLESNNYNTYRSRKYPDWYVALKRTGQYKSGSKTSPGQKAILFLPMSAKC